MQSKVLVFTLKIKLFLLLFVCVLQSNGKRLDLKNHNANSNIPSRLLLKIGAHVLDVNQQCTSLSFVESFFNFAPLQFEKLKLITSETTGKILLFSTSIALTPAIENSTVAKFRKVYWTTKYHSPCSVVLLNSDFVSLESISTLDSLLPGAPHKSFYILLVDSAVNDLNHELNLEHTKYIQNLIVASLNLKKAPVALLTRSWDFKELRQIGSYDINRDKIDILEQGQEAVGLNLFPKFPNFKTNAFVGHDTPFGVDYVENFEATGEWVIHTLDAMWQLCTSLNATFELVAELAMPSEGKNEQGEWDGFTAPLVDGERDFSAVLSPTVERRQVIYLSTPGFYDSISFIHALPKKRQLGKSLGVLIDPLDTLVWIGIIFSTILTFLTLEFTFLVEKDQRRIKSGNRKIRVTIFSLLKQLVDQDGLANAEFSQLVRDHYSSLIAMSLWFLCLIVLESEYKSKLISAIVLPKYISPPRTFPELVDSNFDINLILLDVWRDRFDTSYGKIGKEIMRRGFEVDYLEPEGFRTIFHGNHVIVGISGVFALLGKLFLTDVNGQPLFMRSKDKYFSIYGSVGFGKRHPYCLEPYNRILSYMESAGLSSYQLLKQQEFSAKKGQINAQNWQGILKQYNSTLEDFDTGGRQLLLIVYIVLSYGTFGATVAFVGELLWRNLKTRYFYLLIMHKQRRFSAQLVELFGDVLM